MARYIERMSLTASPLIVYTSGDRIDAPRTEEDSRAFRNARDGADRDRAGKCSSARRTGSSLGGSDRWVGGVHLDRGSADWRWNPDTRRVVNATSGKRHLMPQGKISLDGESLTIESVHAVAAQRATAELSTAARKRMMVTQEVVAGIVSRGDAVYGVNTGFGKLSEVAIPADRLAELQVNLVRSHSAGVGPFLPEREVRAMMLLRANVLAKGFSGARPELVDLLLAMLNGGIHPPVREQGSVGASGDLAPLAALGVALIGEGEVRIR